MGLIDPADGNDRIDIRISLQYFTEVFVVFEQCGDMKGSITVGIPDVLIRSSSQQQFDASGISVQGGDVQRRLTLGIERIDLSLLSNQQVYYVIVMKYRGQMKRCIPAFILGVYIGSPLEQKLCCR